MFELAKLFPRTRKGQEINEEMSEKRHLMEMEYETKASEHAVLSAIVCTKSNINEQGSDELRNGNWWTTEYRNWDEAFFKKRLSVLRHF